jgi:Arc/MetJ family transcription regulator
MRTTLDIDSDLMEEARKSTGLRTKTELVEAGLRALVEAAAAKRLSALAGSVRDASAPYRRRDDAAE